MRILKRVDGSVLWLLDAVAPFAREYPPPCPKPMAWRRERILFAPDRPPAQHLARLSLADLFLDSLPYNAHTTASDALWAGVPLITRLGHAFPGRVAASLLQAAGLPELVTQTQEDYEALAVSLATDPAALAAMKRKLDAQLLHCSTPTCSAARIEAAYEKNVAGLAGGRKSQRLQRLITR